MICSHRKSSICTEPAATQSATLEVNRMKPELNASSLTHTNLSPAALIEHALRKGEGQLSATGALCTVTGARTGRSTLDRFIVEESSTRDAIDWGKVNLPFSAERFEALWRRVEN